MTSELETTMKEEKTVNFDCPDLYVEEMFRYRFFDPKNKDVIFRMQGGYFDGTNFYLAFASHAVSETFAYIVVLDKNGNEVKRSTVLKTGHSNSLSLRNDGTFLVSVGNSHEYHIVDKETLTLIESKSILPYSCLSIDYCSEKDMYAMLDAGWGTMLYHLNSSLAVGKGYSLEVEKETAGQNFFCTKDMLYSVRYKYMDGRYHNFLHMNSWMGELHGLYYLPIPGNLEAQSVSVNGNTVYIPCGNYNSECILYTAKLS